MGDTFALAALVRKRAELAGRVEAAYVELERMLADVAGLDSTLRLFDPDVQLEAIRPRPLRVAEVWGARPHVFVRRVLDVLRRAGGPVATREITWRLLEQQGLDPGDPKVWTPASEGVCKALRGQRRRRIVRSTPGEGQQLLWELAEGWAEATTPDRADPPEG